MSGPAKRPEHLKLVSGTARDDRVDENAIKLPILEVLPAPVDWLPNVHAVKEWERLMPILVANRIIAEADLSAFGHMCALHGKMVQLWAAGEAPTGHMMAQYNALASTFALAPGWRSKVKISADKDTGNKFSKFKKDPSAG
jgi:hypothetical protein